ncbi:hypothetical protein TNCV_324891 [Trichonephila clavipes]|nr:hypothetical protein TNCV_324891 [Trichonephila clavipes]
MLGNRDISNQRLHPQRVAVKLSNADQSATIKRLGNTVLGDSGTLSSGRRDRENCRLSEHSCGSIVLLYGICFPNWKWNLPCQVRVNINVALFSYTMALGDGPCSSEP